MTFLPLPIKSQPDGSFQSGSCDHQFACLGAFAGIHIGRILTLSAIPNRLERGCPQPQRVATPTHLGM